MKSLGWIAGLTIILIGGFFVFNSYVYNEKQGDNTNAPKETAMKTIPVEVTPISHATAVLAWGGKALYTDPIGDVAAFKGQPTPDIIFVTDIHGDHLSTSTLAALMGQRTSLIVPRAVKDLLPKDLAARAIVLKNGEATSTHEFQILAVPMYNLPDTKDARHTKGRGNGYVIERDGFRVYVAGDTAGTPEMRALTNIDMAFVPMNLPYTMGVDEAADAVLAFKPRQVYPYHYRGQDGLADVGKFKQLVNAGNATIDVVLANWYPQ